VAVVEVGKMAEFNNLFVREVLDVFERKTVDLTRRLREERERE
jgi:hypothetical protein